MIAATLASLLTDQERPGTSDCEAITAGFFGQPINTLSSLGLVVAGVWLAIVLRPGRDRPLAWAYIGLLIANGLGSVIYHGPAPSWARFVHDLPIASTTLLVALLLAVGMRRALVPWALGTVVLAVIIAFFPDAAVPMTGVLALAVGVLAVMRFVRVRKFSGSWKLETAALAALALGAAFTALGRTGEPLCEPYSLFQPHSLWHLLMAVALLLLGLAMFRDPH